AVLSGGGHAHDGGRDRLRLHARRLSGARRSAGQWGLDGAQLCQTAGQLALGRDPADVLWRADQPDRPALPRGGRGRAGGGKARGRRMIRLLRPLALAFAVALALPLAAPMPAMAVQPDEVLKDPLLEKRARELS